MVELVTAGVPTITSPVPDTVTVVTPCTKAVFVPAIATGVVVPRFAPEGVAVIDTGRTLKAAVGASSAPVATVTVRGPTAAPTGTRIGTESVVALVTFTGPSRTMSAGANETVVLPLTKLVPVPVMLRGTSCPAVAPLGDKEIVTGRTSNAADSVCTPFVTCRTRVPVGALARIVRVAFAVVTPVGATGPAVTPAPAMLAVQTPEVKSTPVPVSTTGTCEP